MVSYTRRYQKASVIGKAALAAIVFGAGVLAQRSCDVTGNVHGWYRDLGRASSRDVGAVLDALPDSTVYRLFRERFIDVAPYRP